MDRMKLALGLLALTMLPIIAFLALRSVAADRRNETAQGLDTTLEQALAQSPKPLIPGGAPFFFAEKVSLAEARERTSFTIPLPSAVDESSLVEVWVTSDQVARERRSVALRFADGLTIIMDGPVLESPLYAESVAEEGTPFKLLQVNGHAGRGKDPGVSEGLTGKGPYPGSVDWWVGEVQLSIYHPNLSMRELLRIAESMPGPARRPGAR